jgi:hypothetical protein
MILALSHELHVLSVVLARLEISRNKLCHQFQDAALNENEQSNA